MRVCPKCGQEKSEMEFYAKKRECKACLNARSRAWAKANRDKVLAAQKDWDKRNPDKRKANWRKKNLKQFGLTLEQYGLMFESQGGGCAICGGINPNGRRLSVDHCHRTGRIRGLLCSTCNTMLGHARDDVALLRKAINYIQNSNSSE